MRRAAVGALLSAGMLVSGCGSDAELPPAAEPADSPPASVRPAGDVTKVGAGAEGLVFDTQTRLLAVGLRDPDVLALFDPRTGRVVRRVPLDGAPRHLGFGGPGRVLVPAEQENELIQVALPSGRTTATAVGEHPHDAAFAGGSDFVSDEFGDTVSVVRDGRLVDSLAAPQQPGGIATVGRDVVLVAVRERTLEVYDARTFDPAGTTGAGEGPTHVVGLRGRAFVADTEGDAILEYDVRPSPALRSETAAPGAPYGLAADPRRGVLWVTLTARNELAGFALRGGRLKPVGRYPTVEQPNSVAVDPRSGELFVASRESGVIESIRPGPAGEG